MKNDQLDIPETQAALAVRSEPSTVQLLQAVIDRGITAESVGVLKDLMQMRREEIASQNKIAFNRAFFALKAEIATLDFYADKEAKDRSGNTMYAYCSEEEISKKLDPLLFRHGFATMFSQRQEDGRVVAEITLIHSEGHQEKGEFAVRTGATNAAKDATQADTGSTTSAWRHLVMKMFGLKSRIRAENDATVLGNRIPPDHCEYLRELLKESGASLDKFLKFAGVEFIEDIREGDYERVRSALEKKAKERQQ